MMTATTIGLGDIAPQTRAGRLYGIFHMLVSVVIFGSLLGTIVGALDMRVQMQKKAQMLRKQLDMELITSLDRDGDGVDKTEFVCGMLEVLGVISKEDYEPFVQQFHELDKTKDGRLKKDDLVDLVEQNRRKAEAAAAAKVGVDYRKKLEGHARGVCACACVWCVWPRRRPACLAPSHTPHGHCAVACPCCRPHRPPTLRYIDASARGASFADLLFPTFLASFAFLWNNLYGFLLLASGVANGIAISFTLGSPPVKRTYFFVAFFSLVAAVLFLVVFVIAAMLFIDIETYFNIDPLSEHVAFGRLDGNGMTDSTAIPDAMRTIMIQQYFIPAMHQPVNVILFLLYFTIFVFALINDIMTVMCCVMCMKALDKDVPATAA